MKALTLHQPWASLIALGVKTIETRSWSTSYRGPLAIHAAATMPSYDKRYVPGTGVQKDAWENWRLHFSNTPSVSIPKNLPPSGYGEVGYPLPLGAIVATCTLVDVVQINEEPRDDDQWVTWHRDIIRGGVSPALGLVLAGCGNGPLQTSSSTRRP